MNTKVLSLLAVVLSITLLTGCGQKAAPIVDAEPTTDTAPAVAPTAEPTGAIAAPTPTAASTKTVDTATSVVKWNAKKIGGAHFGTVTIKEGNINFDTANKLIWWSITLDMNTITVDDIQGEMQAGLLKHLQSDDFFSVAANPTSTLTITTVKELTPNSYEITADLTIKGKTNPVTFVATVDETMTFSAPIVIDRTLWDITFRSLKFFSDVADKAIEDTIIYDVTLKLTQ